jgi:hypothetical protein
MLKDKLAWLMVRCSNLWNGILMKISDWAKWIKKEKKAKKATEIPIRL